MTLASLQRRIRSASWIPLGPGEHPVEHHEVGQEALDLLLEVDAGREAADDEALGGEGGDDGGADGGVGLDHEDACGMDHAPTVGAADGRSRPHVRSGRRT